jgi:hypothetical protein
MHKWVTFTFSLNLNSSFLCSSDSRFRTQWVLTSLKFNSSRTIVSTLKTLITTFLAYSWTVMWQLPWIRLSICSAFVWFTDVLSRLICGMFSTSVWPSLNYLLQSQTCVLDSISSPNYDLSLARISVGFTFMMVRNVTILCCARAKGTTCSLIMITTDKKQADMQWYIITVIDAPP